MGTGLFFMPRRVARAFQRGRHTRNLYRAEYGEKLLGSSVEEMTRELGLEEPTPAPTAKDRLAFVGWSAASLLMAALASATFLAPLALAAWVLVGLLR
jgi:hypothetical protein